MAGEIPFRRDFAFEYGRAERLTPLIRRVAARNPSPFTFKGTGTYIIGQGKVAVIDPGPKQQDHIDALLKALDGETVTHILITHTHNDHSPAAAAIKAATGAKTYGFGPHGSGRPEERVGGVTEEGGDRDFVPDVKLREGDVIQGGGDGGAWHVGAVETPGHTSNHLCFALHEEDTLFTGDHVMGWSTTVVAPPDGGMAQYMASLRKLLARDDRILYPTHGGPVDDPKPFLQAYIDHRLEREAQILDCLRKGVDTIPEIVARLYADVDKRLHVPAARSVLAHLIQLEQEGRVEHHADGYFLAA
jgi:glyoxylase-like metal-dependent hydrolase (beta-lactamase superfamily II)